MTRRSREAAERLRRLEQAVDLISRSIEKIEVATIVREPASALSADAYNGLRKQIVAAAGERVAHLHQLARFAQAVESGDPAPLPSLVREWSEQAGLLRVDDPSDTGCFDVLAGSGSALRMLRPAYVDQLTGRPIVMGQAERFEPHKALPRTSRHADHDREVPR
ncbi:hypothetical protein [Amycolatopsis sp. Hca4]|uniref:hypothetical protein n=1 Tax=Amycolatopsis sp. Hca4 TaxID=2742131 RepID=UPI001592517E|nr:hypothetical protein [Amycolatopsis sp. Hca4]QKV75293.1 hypothetical protein HUT10_17085 [Amycolatopsis sp. Hca4]